MYKHPAAGCCTLQKIVYFCMPLSKGSCRSFSSRHELQNVVLEECEPGFAAASKKSELQLVNTHHARQVSHYAGQLWSGGGSRVLDSATRLAKVLPTRALLGLTVTTSCNWGSENCSRALRSCLLLAACACKPPRTVMAGVGAVLISHVVLAACPVCVGMRLGSVELVTLQTALACSDPACPWLHAPVAHALAISLCAEIAYGLTAPWLTRLAAPRTLIFGAEAE